MSTGFDWYKRAQRSIAHSALTNSKRPETFVKGVYPTHLTHGRGCHVWDTNGRKYIDFICGLGTNLLGYGNDEIGNAIRDQAYRGCSLSLGTDLEVKLAEKLKEFFPWIERWRFLKTGSEACSASLRIARAYKPECFRVISEGYHGWSESFIGLTPPAIGADHSISKFNFTQPEFDKYITDNYPGQTVPLTHIVEPVELDNSQERINHVRGLKKQKHDNLLICDEIITGFRYKSYSVSKHHGITPDLLCLGKAIANGLPLAAVGGKADIMECDEYFVSSTYAGETLSIVAAQKVIELLQNKYDINELWQTGQYFLDSFNAMYDKVQIKGYATRGRFEGEALDKALFMQEACKAGLLFGPSWFINFHHKNVMDEVLKTCESVFLKLKKGMAKLEGEMPSSPFVDRVRK